MVHMTKLYQLYIDKVTGGRVLSCVPSPLVGWTNASVILVRRDEELWL
jgi:hypothetical protein